ncbi:unnamed protein product, partial [Amoebophrya sp. A25]
YYEYLRRHGFGAKKGWRKLTKEQRLDYRRKAIHRHAERRASKEEALTKLWAHRKAGAGAIEDAERILSRLRELQRRTSQLRQKVLVSREASRALGAVLVDINRDFAFPHSAGHYLGACAQRCFDLEKDNPTPQQLVGVIYRMAADCKKIQLKLRKKESERLQRESLVSNTSGSGKAASSSSSRAKSTSGRPNQATKTQKGVVAGSSQAAKSGSSSSRADGIDEQKLDLVKAKQEELKKRRAAVAEAAWDLAHRLHYEQLEAFKDFGKKLIIMAYRPSGREAENATFLVAWYKANPDRVMFCRIDTPTEREGESFVLRTAAKNASSATNVCPGAYTFDEQSIKDLQRDEESEVFVLDLLRSTAEASWIRGSADSMSRMRVEDLSFYLAAPAVALVPLSRRTESTTREEVERDESDSEVAVEDARSSVRMVFHDLQLITLSQLGAQRKTPEQKQTERMRHVHEIRATAVLRKGRKGRDRKVRKIFSALERAHKIIKQREEAERRM